jgi:hypothetical protein
MATNQGTTATNIPSGASEMAGELQNTLNSADSLAAQRVQTLQLVHQARVSRLSRELDALKAEHAPESDVKAAQATVDAATFTAGRAAMVNQQLTTAEPEVAQTGWALHGRVFDVNLKPVSGFTVFLVDAQKSYQKAYGFAFTDDTGYFLINYPGPGTSTKAEPKSKQPQAASQRSTATGPVAATQPGAAPPPAGPATPPSPQDSPTTPQLFLEIADTKAQPVYLSETPFQPVTGSATYQNVTLAPGNQPIGDPPQEIRDIAMPPIQKKNSSRPSRRK